MLGLQFFYVLAHYISHVVDTDGLPRLPLWKSTKIACMGTNIIHGRYVPSTRKYIVKLKGKEWVFQETLDGIEEKLIDVELVLLSQDYGLILLNQFAYKIDLSNGSLVWKRSFSLQSILPIGVIGNLVFFLKDHQVLYVDLDGHEKQGKLVQSLVSLGVEGKDKHKFGNPCSYEL